MNYDIPLKTLSGEKASLSDYKNRALLVVNVASECGATPQYRQLEALHREYQNRGLSVLGFPCNQFGAQEPGSAAEIREFCSTNYEVSFPLFEKTDVNGPDRHPLFAELCEVKDAQGKAGDVQWNFEKFVVSADGRVQRFRTQTEPDAPEVLQAIESGLPE
jgi:glutathione peroxidase